MAKRKKPRVRVRFVYRQSSPLLKCAILAAIVFCTIATLVLQAAIRKEGSVYDTLRSAAAWFEQDNQRLENNIAELGTKQSILNIAKEKLGLVDKNSIFFTPVE